MTAEFNRNVLRVLNRELGADFDAGRLRAPGPVRRGARLDRDAAHLRGGRRRCGCQRCERFVHFEEGEVLRTEVSCKFRQEQVEAELAAAGLHLSAWWTDAAEDFALSLSFKR